MEGLIKGLVDVAIGHHEDRGREEEVRTSEQRDRSSWAEVVSGEQENDGRSSNRRNEGYEQRYHGSSNQQEQEWGSGGSRPSMRPQESQYEGYGRPEYSEQGGYEASRPNPPSGGEGNDGWEVAGKKKPQRRHKQVNKEKWDNYKRPASEQEYSDEAEIGSQLKPSQDELSDLALACNKLWELDLNRLIPEKDYEIDCGEGKKVYQNQDMAEGFLFTYLNEDIFRRPTFSRFCSLLDNYNPHEGYKEEVTSQEKQEEAAFIEEISRTAPIMYLHKYLSAKGIVSENFQEFKRMLTGLWFDLYGRGGTSSCSSAFEHVFVGEIKNRGDQEVSGFHNWLQFYMEEAKGRVDYQGYIFPRRRGERPDSKTQLLTIQFEWNGVLKSVSSTLVGVSPEFEIALYTLCFYVGGEDNRVQLGPYNVNIKCYRHGDKLGSAFPIAES